MNNIAANRQWRVARYPESGEAVSRDLFSWTTDAVPDPAEGEFLVRTVCLALGPAQRGYLAEATQDAFLQPVAIGDVMRGRGVGRIIKSRHPDYPDGAIFVGSLGWQDYSLQQPRGKEFVYSTRLVTEPIAPLSGELGTLGQAGATAYFGLREAGQVQANDHVLVSAAAGGLGSCAGQIARALGASNVVGIAGGPEKCLWLIDELGFNAAIDYQSQDVGERLRALFPHGIDVFFDSVGGDLLNTALGHLAMHARVAVAGFIATDYDPQAAEGPLNYRNLVSKRASMQGFVFFDYWDRYAEAAAQLRDWHRRGLLRSTEHIGEGLEQMPDALAGLFTGANRGVSICRVSPDE
ncbi:MAG: NADP-dependent oxidoreductase [Gammaproteobacteria bacterium]|nr:NADP-dependent oxidoreductase [Gammaproteobacteria bacterium]